MDDKKQAGQPGKGMGGDKKPSDPGKGNPSPVKQGDKKK